MPDGDDLLPAEARARRQIDVQLGAAGWRVVDRKDLNPLVPTAVCDVAAR